MNSLRILLTIQSLEDRVGGTLYVRDLEGGFCDTVILHRL